MNRKRAASRQHSFVAVVRRQRRRQRQQQQQRRPRNPDDGAADSTPETTCGAGRRTRCPCCSSSSDWDVSAPLACQPRANCCRGRGCRQRRLGACASASNCCRRWRFDVDVCCHRQSEARSLDGHDYANIDAPVGGASSGNIGSIFGGGGGSSRSSSSSSFSSATATSKGQPLVADGARSRRQGARYRSTPSCLSHSSARRATEGVARDRFDCSIPSDRHEKSARAQESERNGWQTEWRPNESEVSVGDNKTHEELRGEHSNEQSWNELSGSSNQATRQNPSNCIAGRASIKSILKRGGGQAAAGEEERVACDTRESSRRNCASRRGSALSGLVELFEQQVRVSPASATANGLGLPAAGGKVGDGRMRDILTRVVYEPAPGSTSSSSDGYGGGVGDLGDEPVDERSWGATSTGGGGGCECCAANEQGDSLNYCTNPCQHQPSGRQVDDQTQHCAQCQPGTRTSRSPIERLVSRGAVRVLPSRSPVRRRESAEYLHRKLTSTNWQPPTDGRKYELRTHERRKLGTSHEQQGRQAATQRAGRELDTIVRHQTSSSRRQLEQLARLHQLDELAGLYRVGRQGRRGHSSAERVEELIEQLERATSEMDEDEHLLERAERREMSANCAEMAAARHRRLRQQLPGQELASNELAPRDARLIDFGRRADVDPLEERSIAQAHCALGADKTASETMGTRPSFVADRHRDDLAVRRVSGQPASRSSSLNNEERQRRICSPTGMDPRVSYLLCSDAYAPRIEGRAAASALVDSLERRARLDDLHYRTLRRREEPAEPPFGVPRRPEAHCAPPPSPSAPNTLQRPSGTRRPTATERLGRSSSGQSFLDTQNCDRCRQQRRPQSKTSQLQPTKASSQQELCRSSSASQDKQRLAQRARRTPESRVSFSPTAAAKPMDSGVPAMPGTETDPRPPSRASGAASADSGIAATASNYAGSPVAQRDSSPPGDPSSGSKRRSEGEGQVRQAAGVDDANTELEKEVDLATERPDSWAPGDSCAIERVQAELKATPTRRRPRIKLAEPRSKSPLLRVGHNLEATGEREAPESREHEHQRKTVTVQRYEDSWPRRAKGAAQRYLASDLNSIESGRAMDSMEFKCEFGDEDDEATCEEGDRYEDFLARHAATPLAPYESNQSSTTPNETSGSSIEYLEQIGSTGRNKPEAADWVMINRQPNLNSAAKMMQARGDETNRAHKAGPKRSGVSAGGGDSARPIMFSIGQYDSTIKRRDLKIL